MRAHTVDFKEEIKNPGRQIDSIITYDGGSLSASDLKNVKPILNSEILKSVMKGLNFDSYRELNEGLEINYQFGLWIPSREEYEYLDYGNYIIYSKELNEDTGIWSYKCYDKMVYAMVDYEPFGITFPITVRNYINAFATHLGLTFKNINDEFTNYNKEINEDHYIGSEGEKLGFSIRDIFDEISSVIAGSLIVNNDDELEIKYFTETNDIIDEHYLKDVNVKFGKMVGPYNTVYLTRAADSDTIYRPRQLPENIIPITISENQIMNGNDRDQFIDEIYQRLNGLEYCINDFTSTGVLYYEFGDIYTVNIGENNYKCIMLNDEPVIQGGIVENIFSNEVEESTIDYEKADVTDNVMRQTILYVDKKNGEIVGRVGDLEEDYSQLKLDVNGLSLDVTQRGDNILEGTEFYDLSQWGWLDYFMIYEGSDMPSSKDYKYWYDTTNNIVYQSDDWETRESYTPPAYNWTPTEYTRKEIQEYNVLFANINESEEISSNFVSERAASIGLLSTKRYNIDTTKGNLTISFKYKKLKEDTKLEFQLWGCNYSTPNSWQSSCFIFLLSKVLEVEDNKIHEFSITIPIINTTPVEAIASDTEPEDTTAYWLKNGMLRKYVDNEWIIEKEAKIVHSDLSDYEESSNVYLYPVKSSVISDEDYAYAVFSEVYPYQDYKMRSIWLTFWGVDINTGLDVDDSFLIGDIKVEYGQVPTTWTNNMNEVYGKNYKMDINGFEIDSNGYIMHIDEDEVTGSYKNEIQFQLNKHNTYSKVGKFVETNQDGLITKKLSNNMYIRYIE